MRPKNPEPDLEGLLDALADAGVEHIVVGGVAAVIHGAPITTLDLDVVYQKTKDNIERLACLLETLGARVRDPAGRDLTPGRSHLEAAGQLLLKTHLGPLDPMGNLHDGRTYEDLLPHSIVIEREGLKIRVLDLQTLVEVKTEAGRMKDLQVIPLLRALLAGND